MILKGFVLKMIISRGVDEISTIFALSKIRTFQRYPVGYTNSYVERYLFPPLKLLIEHTNGAIVNIMVKTVHLT